MLATLAVMAAIIQPYHHVVSNPTTICTSPACYGAICEAGFAPTGVGWLQCDPGASAAGWHTKLGYWFRGVPAAARVRPLVRLVGGIIPGYRTCTVHVRRNRAAGKVYVRVQAWPGAACTVRSVRLRYTS